MVDNLLGYLLGALDAEDLEQVSLALASDLELQRQLEQVRQALEPLHLCRDEINTPPDLAVRTWVVVRQRVAGLRLQ